MFAITMAFIAGSFGLLSSLTTQAQETITDQVYDDSEPAASRAYSGDDTGGGMGCYTVQILDCGWEIGQRSFCNFTGSYGPPYHCDQLNCYGTQSGRTCVLVSRLR